MNLGMNELEKNQRDAMSEKAIRLIEPDEGGAKLYEVFSG